jgi:hypothetical protein
VHRLSPAKAFRGRHRSEQACLLLYETLDTFRGLAGVLQGGAKLDVEHMYLDGDMAIAVSQAPSARRQRLARGVVGCTGALQ